VNLRWLRAGLLTSWIVASASCSDGSEQETVMDYRDAIERYYQAYRDRDRESLRSLLTPDFHFASSFGEYNDRDAMLDEIWPGVGQSWATNLRVFGNGPDFVVLYEHENAPGVQRPAMTMAEYVRFEGDRIAAIEVFVGRPVTLPSSAR
jgi:hypothetical protein